MVLFFGGSGQGDLNLVNNLSQNWRICPETIVFFFFFNFWHIFVRSGPGKSNQRKVSSWTFHRGVLEQKFNVNRACFPKEKHQNSQKSAKFMNFSFWPFLWFGLPGRLLILTNLGPPDCENNRRDRFWRNLGLGAFLNAVRGRSFRSTWLADEESSWVMSMQHWFWASPILADTAYHCPHKNHRPIKVLGELISVKITALSGVNRANRVIRTNRKFEWFRRIGLTRYKNRGFNCERFARIDPRESRCESPVPLSHSMITDQKCFQNHLARLPKQVAKSPKSFCSQGILHELWVCNFGFESVKFVSWSAIITQKILE